MKGEILSMNTATKSTSLKELGYTIKPEKGKDEKGNEFVFKVVGPAPVFYIKQTKRGRLIAVKDKTATAESTIQGLYNFKVVGEGPTADLVGVRATGSVEAPKEETAA